MADGELGENCPYIAFLFQLWRAVKTHETRVKSYFRGRNTRFFEEDASRAAHPAQLKRFRDSFAISNGEHGVVDFEAIGDVRIDYEGQLTLVSSISNGQFFFNHCSGPDVSIMKYPSALKEFRSGLSSKSTIENAAFCLSVSGYNFHCFLFEILPSLFAFKAELQETDKLILGATAGGSFIEEFNKVLEFHKSIELLPLRSSIEVTNAYAVTSFPFRIYPIDILEEIRTRMRQESHMLSSDKGSEICFIGRADRDRNRRNLLNEDSVLSEIVGAFGKVSVIRPGITKLIETVSQIRDARVIVGMLGGSLAHLIWAHSLELFVEIVPYNYFGATETEELSKIYGFEYHRVNSSNVDSHNWAQADQNCDIAELNSMLQSLKHRDIR
jgi:capsular polysaccharide biosynthesis protein